ncbi:MAG: DUF2730 family protein [Magnetospirillum sp.]|nr:DUF2730 family protein [Magnetospirillum sp.]
MDDLLKWWPILVVLANGLGLWIMWSLSKKFVPKADFDTFRSSHEEQHDELDEQLKEGELRFARLDERLGHLPTKDDLVGLRINIERLSGDIRVATAVLRKVEGPVDLVVENAMNGVKP